MKTKINTLLIAIAIMSLFLTGCGKQSFVSVSDTRGLEEGAPVVWYEGNAYVGKVSKIKEAEGNHLIYIEFQKNFEKAIRADVKACPLLEPKYSPKPILLLVGGKDTTMPILEPGSQIPEISLSELQPKEQMNFWKWFGSAKKDSTIALAVLILVLCVICVLKIVAKLIKFVLVLAIIAIVVSYSLNLSGDWKQYKGQTSKYIKEIKIEEIQDWLQKHVKENIPELMQKFNAPKAPENGNTPATPEQP